MVFDPSEPYDNLPPPPPESVVETPAVLKQCLRAARALAELKGTGGLIPDQSIIINSIPLQEAKLSSEIENIVTTQDALFRAALDESKATDPQTKEVLRYRTALHHGHEVLQRKPLSMALVENVCRIILGKPVSFRGESQQVFIGNRQTGEIIYTPPRGGPALRRMLGDLEAYLRDDGGPDPLIRMAVGHYQFEAIHPFIDGNGRSGRILNILFFLHAKLLEIPVLYLSRYIIQNKADYYRLLRGVTEKEDWEPWLLYVLRGVEETANWTTSRVLAIRDLFEVTAERCRAEMGPGYSKELIELIFRQAYCRIGFVVEAGIAKRQAASAYLRRLEQLGVLTSEKRGREVVYKNPALVDVLTA